MTAKSAYLFETCFGEMQVLLPKEDLFASGPVDCSVDPLVVLLAK